MDAQDRHHVLSKCSMESLRLKSKIITSLETMSKKYAKAFKWIKDKKENEEAIRLQHEIIKAEVLEMREDFEKMSKIHGHTRELLNYVENEKEQTEVQTELNTQKTDQQKVILVSEKNLHIVRMRQKECLSAFKENTETDEELVPTDIQIMKMVGDEVIDDMFSKLKLQKAEKEEIKTENASQVNTNGSSHQDNSSQNIVNQKLDNPENTEEIEENPKNTEKIKENPKNTEKSEENLKNTEKIENKEKTQKTQNEQKEESDNQMENPGKIISTARFLFKKDIIDIQPFSGKPEDFGSFIELFENLIDNDKSVPDVLKFAALKSLTTERAAEQIARYPADGSLYKEALQRLKKMFGSCNHQYTAIWENIKKLKQAKPDVSSCRKVFNEIAISIEKLKRLGFETNSLPYITEIKSKLPKLLMADVIKKERKLPNQRFENIDELIEFVEELITTQEEISAASRDSDTVPIEINTFKTDTNTQRAINHRHKEQSITEKFENERRSRVDYGSRNNSNKSTREPTERKRSTTPYHANRPYGEVHRSTSRNNFERNRGVDRSNSQPRRSNEGNRERFNPRERTPNRNRSSDRYQRDQRYDSRDRRPRYERSYSRDRRPRYERSYSRDRRDFRERSNRSNSRDNRVRSGSRERNVRFNEREFRTRQFKTSTKGSNLFIAKADIQNEKDENYPKATLLIDTGSDSTFIRKELAEKLKLRIIKKDIKLRITHFGKGNESSVLSNEVEATIMIQNKKVKVHAFTVDQITKKTKATKLSHNDIQYLNEHQINNYTTNEEKEPDILVGLDYLFDLTRNIKMRKLPSGLTLIRCALGSIICGSIRETDYESANVFYNSIDEEDLEKLFFLEDTHKEELNFDNTTIVKNFESSVRIDENGITVGWPWKPHGKEELSDNKDIAYGRLISLVQSKNSTKKLKIIKGILADQLARNYIEEISLEEVMESNNPKYFMPMQIVQNENSETTKDRVVYDCSSKKRNKKSLNEVLAQGPVAVPQIAGILLRARTSNLVMISDVEKAFHTLTLREEDRNTTCFLFLRDIDKPPIDDNIVIYRFRSVPFGVVSSPFLLTESIKFYSDKMCENKIVRKMIEKSLYVDNLFVFLNDETEIPETYIGSKEFFNKIKMNLREFWVNDVNLDGIVRKEDISKSKENQKILGYIWNTKKDTFKVKRIKRFKTKQPSKREAIGVLSSFYDPLGAFDPITAEGKLLIPDVFRTAGKWDAKISIDAHNKVNEYANKMAKENFEIPRKIIKFSKNDKYEIHTFSDASEKLFSACTYLVVTNAQGKRQVQFLMAKQRLAGTKKKVSMPKLELSAIELGAKLTLLCIKELDISIKECVFHSDSQIALQWLKKPEVKQVFVENRVTSIRKISIELNELNIKTSFRYVETNENPADHSTRGIESMEKLLKSNWFSGPEWLTRNENHWNNTLIIRPSDMQNKEKVLQVNQTQTEDEKDITDFTNSWTKMKRTMSYVLSFLNKTLAKKLNPENKMLLLKNIPELETFTDVNSTEVMRNEAAEKAIIRYHQKKEKIEENREKGWIKIENLVFKKTRLENALNGKNLITLKILKPNTHIAKAIIRSYHEKFGHCGVNATIGHIQEKYYGTGLRRTVKDVLKKCVLCRKMNSLPFEYPESPHLPKDRVTESEYAFQNCGTDFCGPFTVRNGRGNVNKVYICIFTCLSSRAVHLETTGSLSTQEFLLALTRFTSRRGVPKIMRSDNGTTFTLASKILNQKKQENEKIKELQNEVEKQGIDWRFNVPAAPWQGGNFERMVALVKKGLTTCIGKNTVNREVFETVVTRVEKIINERPLTVASNDQNSNVWEQIIRPIHLICPKWETKRLEIETENDEYEEYTNWVKSCNEYVGKFWKIWKNDYILNNEYFKKTIKLKGAKNEIKVPKEGEIVLVKEDNQRRKEWRMGRIEEIVKSKDDQIRSAMVKMNNKRGKKLIRRPVNMLIPLEIRCTTETETEKPKQPTTRTIGTRSKTSMLMTLMMLFSILNTTTASPATQAIRLLFKMKTPKNNFWTNEVIKQVATRSTKTDKEAVNVNQTTVIVCTKNGALLIDRKPDVNSKYTICADRFCFKVDGGPKVQVALPAHITAHKHMITWRKRVKGKYELEEKMCPANNFCENIDCWLCSQRISNPQCSPIITCMIVIIILILSSLSIITCIRKTISNMRPKLSERKVRFNAKNESIEIEQSELSEEKEEDSVSVTSNLSNGSRWSIERSILGNKRIIVMILCTLIQQSECCDLTIPIKHNEIINGKLHSVEDIFMSPITTEVCINVKYKNRIVANYKIKKLESTYQCVEGKITAVRNATLENMSVKHCGAVGRCSGDKCDDIHPDTKVEDLELVNDYIGKTYCTSSCGGLGCGCWSFTDGCLFYRNYAIINVDEPIFEIFRCTQWSAEAHFSIEHVQRKETKNDEISLKEGFSKEISYENEGKIEIILISNDNDIQPTYFSSQYMRFENSLAIINIDENNIAVKCDLDDTEECTYNEVCQCTYSTETAHCNCKSQNFHKILKNDENGIPIIFEKFKIINENNKPTITTTHNKVHIQVVMDEVLENSIDIDETNCTITDYTNVEGCYGCEKGASANISCEAEKECKALVECNDFETVIQCKEHGKTNVIKRHFATSSVNEICKVRCGDVEMLISLEGELHYIPSDEAQEDHHDRQGKGGFSPHIPEIPSPSWWTTMNLVFENLPKIIGFTIIGVTAIIAMIKIIPVLIKIII